MGVVLIGHGPKFLRALLLQLHHCNNPRSAPGFAWTTFTYIMETLTHGQLTQT